MEITNEFESCQQSRNIFWGKPFITYSRSLFIFYVPKLSMNRESGDPLWGSLSPCTPPLILSLSPLYLRALALTLPLKLSLSLALRQLEDE